MERVSDIRITRAYQAINYLVNQVQNEKLKKLCGWSQIRAHKFYAAFGSAVDTAHHHAYPGGLAVHTAEVMTLADKHREACYHLMEPLASRDVILVAALFHDFAKIWDYDETGKKTEYRKLIRHVNGSHAEFKSAIVAHGFEVDIPKHIVSNIEHCILAHHGRPEWSSPVEPQTVEAHILHCADMLSAKYGVDK